MSPTERILYDRIRKRAAFLQPDLAKRLLASYDVIRAVLSEAELQRAIKAGHVDAIINEMLADDVLDPAFAPLRARVDQAVLDAAKKGATELPDRFQGPAFDVLNPKIIEAARALDTRVITTLKTEVRETVRQHVIAGIKSGANPRVIARRVKTVVGLAPNQEQWVANFRRQLTDGDRAALGRVLGRGQIRSPSGETIVRTSHADGKGLSARDLDILRRKLGRPSRPTASGPVWFHGTPVDILATKQKWFAAHVGETGVPVVWGSSDVFTAEGYSRGEIDLAGPDKTGKYRLSKSYYADMDGGGVYSLRSKPGTKILVVDGGGKQWYEIGQRGPLERARAGGYDAVVFKNVGDNYSSASKITSDVIAWLDPKHIELAPEDGPAAPRVLTEQQIDRMTDAYRKRMLALNTETQTRTMALDATRAGQRGSWEDAIANGVVDRSRLRRVWVAVDDARTRPEHRALDGTEVSWDAPYPNGETVPGESTYNCRCIERITLAREAVAA